MSEPRTEAGRALHHEQHRGCLLAPGPCPLADRIAALAELRGQVESKRKNAPTGKGEHTGWNAALDAVLALAHAVLGDAPAGGHGVGGDGVTVTTNPDPWAGQRPAPRRGQLMGWAEVTDVARGEDELVVRLARWAAIYVEWGCSITSSRVPQRQALRLEARFEEVVTTADGFRRREAHARRLLGEVLPVHWNGGVADMWMNW